MNCLVLKFSAWLMAAAIGPAAPGNEAAKPADQPLEIYVAFEVKPEEKASFVATMRENVKQTRQEEGNLAFYFLEHREDPNKLYLYERWQSQAALDEHMKKPHLLAVIEATKTALAKPAEQLNLHEIAPYGSDWKEDPSPPADTANVAVVFQVKPGAEEPFIAAWDHTPEIRRSEGNRIFSLHRVIGDPRTFVLFERWSIVDAHEAHLAKPENQALGSVLEPLLARPLMDGRALLKDISE